MRIHIRQGRLIDPANDIDKITDIYLADGKVASVGDAPDNFVAEKIIEAKGSWVLPGLVDCSTRLREPGLTQKGTIASETQAAASRGITHLCCWPDTSPCLDSTTVVERIQQQAKAAGFAHVYPLGALTTGLAGTQLADLLALQQAGCPALTNAQHPIHSALVLLQSYQYAANADLLVVIRPEEPDLYAGTVAHEGDVSTRLGLPSSPDCAETIAVTKHLQLIEHTKVRAHFSALSSGKAVALIAEAQKQGLSVSADTAVHHLHLSDRDVCNFDSNCHLRPPLRTMRDREALVQGICDGVITAICSDHQPHEETAKLAPFGDSEPGLSGLETLLCLTLSLVRNSHIPLSTAIRALTIGPANNFGLSAGSLGVGDSANLCILEPEAEWTVGHDTLKSHGKNTPFFGWSLLGQVTYTICAGRLVHTL